MQKDVLFCVADFNPFNDVKIDKILVEQNSILKMRMGKMLKWVR